MTDFPSTGPHPTIASPSSKSSPIAKTLIQTFKYAIPHKFRKSNTDKTTHQDGAGWTPLMIASSLKDTATSEPLINLLLAKNADPTLTTSTGATALHFAASKSNLDTAKKLLEHKASARVKDKRGQLPLHRAAAVGNVPMIKLLLASRSPVNATDADGCTALHHAIAEGHGDAAVVLLKVGAETDKKDSTGALALDLAPDAKVSLAAFSLRFVRCVADFGVGQRLHHKGRRGRGYHPVDGNHSPNITSR
jgi:26S proteasome non-ATPase regulatory subunit 10